MITTEHRVTASTSCACGATLDIDAASTDLATAGLRGFDRQHAPCRRRLTPGYYWCNDGDGFDTREEAQEHCDYLNELDGGNSYRIVEVT